MKMRFPLFAIAAASVFAASCTSDKDLYDENYQNEVAELTYDQNFKKKFGTPALTQDFNMAEDFAVTVNPGTAKNIKIYVNSYDNINMLVADYNVTGTQSLAFSAPEGTEVVYVVADNGSVLTASPKNGEADFTSMTSRGVNNFSNNDVKITAKDGFNKNEMKNYTVGLYNGLIATKKTFEVGFSDGASKMEHYGYNAFGIYYYDKNNNKVDVPVWTSFSTGESGGSETHGFEVDFSNLMKENNDCQISWGFYLERIDGTWSGNGSKAIFTPAKNEDGSYVSLSKIYDLDYKNGTCEHNGFYAAAGLNNRNWTCVGFELQEGNNDIHNELIFVVTDGVDIVTPEAYPWALACEDLGNTDDFDFNDVVFSVDYVAGKTTMNVKPLAAGGTLSSNLWYGNQDLGEIHTLLGAAPNTITNTHSKGTPGAIIPIPVPADFNVHKGMKDFKVVVETGEESTRTITLKEEGSDKAPMMICVPGSWAWPYERTDIQSAYNDFTKWVQDEQPFGAAWWKNVTGKVVE